MTKKGNAYEPHVHDPYFYTSLFIGRTVREISQGMHRLAGFLYLGYSKKLRVLKFGGTDLCPLCRMKGVHKVLGKRVILTPLAIAFSDDWRTFEQKFLGQLGEPKFGREWFEPGQRFSWLVKHGIMHPLPVLELKVGVEIMKNHG